MESLPILVFDGPSLDQVVRLLLKSGAEPEIRWYLQRHFDAQIRGRKSKRGMKWERSSLIVGG